MSCFMESQRVTRHNMIYISAENLWISRIGFPLCIFQRFGVDIKRE
jgi:hypothetical protein